jgi:hypothetical protein
MLPSFSAQLVENSKIEFLPLTPTFYRCIRSFPGAKARLVQRNLSYPLERSWHGHLHEGPVCAGSSVLRVQLRDYPWLRVCQAVQRPGRVQGPSPLVILFFPSDVGVISVT